jgi:hypothetical protein
MAKLALTIIALLLVLPGSAVASPPPVYEQSAEFTQFRGLVTGQLTERANKKTGPDPGTLFAAVRAANDQALVHLDVVVGLTIDYYRQIHDAETARLLAPLDGVRRSEIAAEKRGYQRRLARVDARYRARISKLRRTGRLTQETRSEAKKLWRSERKTAGYYRRQGIVLAGLDFQQAAIPIQEQQYDAWIILSDTGVLGETRDRAKVAYWETFNLARTLIEKIDPNSSI